MPRPKLKAPGNNGSPAVESDLKPVALSPINISGVVVKKKDLVEALRIYMPLIADIEAFEDGQHFYLILASDKTEPQSPG